MTANLRKTCLKPEYASLYPEVPANIWLGAAGVAATWPLGFAARLVPTTGYRSECCRMSTSSSGVGAAAGEPGGGQAHGLARRQSET